MPIKILDIIADKCKQLNEPPPKPIQENEKNCKTVPLTDKKNQIIKINHIFLNNNICKRCLGKA